MLVEYIEMLVGTTRIIKLHTATFCCSKMKQAFEEGFICFGDYDEWFQWNSNVNIIRSKRYGKDIIWDNMKISFCPFCSDKIRIKLFE